MKTYFYPDPRRIMLGLAELAAAAALIFYPIYTIEQPFIFTARQWVSYLLPIPAASVLMVLGFDAIAEEFGKRKPEP